MGKFIDMKGKRFGKFIVVERSFDYLDKKLSLDRTKTSFWLCKCDCGNQKVIRGSSLRRGNVKSCGCLKLKHGGCGKPIYSIWGGMIQRCYNPRSKAYYRYGRRGIKVCEQWSKFENFYKDMGDCPKGLELDRINNNGDYCKENCRWTTHKINVQNSSKVRLITFNNKTQCLSEWAREINISLKTLWLRLTKWTIEKSLTTPIRK